MTIKTQHAAELKFEIWKAYDEGFRNAFALFNTLLLSPARKNFFKNSLDSHTDIYLEKAASRLQRETGAQSL